MNQEIITPEIIDLQPAPVKGALAKSAWDSLPLEQRRSDNLQVLRQAVNDSGAHFLDLCHREGLRPDFSVVVVNHHETHNHYTHQGVDMAALALAMQQAQAPLLEALRAQQQQGLTAEEVLALVQAQQQPLYYPGPTYQPYQPPEINVYVDAPDVYNDFHPTVEAHSSSRSESNDGYWGSFPYFFGVVWVLALLFAFVSAGQE